MPDPSQYVHSDAMRNMSEFGFIGYLQQAVTKDLVEPMALALLGQQAYAGNDLPKEAQELTKRLAKQVEVMDGLATPAHRHQAQPRVREQASKWESLGPRQTVIKT